MEAPAAKELASPPTTPPLLPSPQQSAPDGAEKPDDVKPAPVSAAATENEADTAASDPGGQRVVPVVDEKRPDTVSEQPKPTAEKSPTAAPEQPKPNDEKRPEKSPETTPANAKLGKKLLRTIQMLEWGVEDLFDESSSSVPSKITEHIKTLQTIGEDFKGGDSSKGSKADDESDDDEESDFLCQVKKISTDDWPKGYYEKDGQKKSVIIAVYRSVSGPVDGSEHAARTQLSTHKERLHKVAINNNTLFDELSEVSEIVPDHFPTIIAAPFKLLVRYHAKMADRLTQLKKDLEELDRVASNEEGDIQKKGLESHPTNQTAAQYSTPSTEEAPTPEPPKTDQPQAPPATEEVSEAPQTEPSGPPKALLPPRKEKPVASTPQQNTVQDRKRKTKDLTTRLSYLQLLYDFIQSDLGSFLQLQSKMDDGTAETIAFEDLWYLFKPGEILYSKEHGHDRLYQCYSVTGGQPRRRNFSSEERDMRRRYPWEAEESDSDTEKPPVVRNKLAGIGVMTPFIIDCFYMGFDGVSVGPVDSLKRISSYNNEIRIVDLPVFPLRFHKAKDEIEAKLEAQGRRLITSYGHMSYNGTTVPIGSRSHQEDISGDIFIDLKSYYRDNPSRRPRLGVLRATEPDFTETEESLRNEARDPGDYWMLADREVDFHARETFMTSHTSMLEPTAVDLVKNSVSHLQLLSYRLPAYVFRSRTYVQIDIHVAEEINKSEEVRESGFEDLVIPEGHRKLLIALVQNHLSTRKAESERGSQHKGAASQIDIVRGKGRGLIILLHGPPGSGKTSTAETLAAYTQRPLYSITCGDLGTSPSDVEKNLEIHTTRAHKWDCVLLLDEADVFLSRRDWHDTERNALVSVFLRQLEYYSGILFLTTNRIGALDEAFKSRIHVSLRYPSIGLDETIKIWENILDRIDRDNRTGAADVPIRFDRNALLKYARSHYKKNEAAEPPSTWNGRQIRNAFQLAIALGRHERERRLSAAGTDAAPGKKKPSVQLTVPIFRSIAETAREFEEYLFELKGGQTDSQIAHDEWVRYDRQGSYSRPAAKDYGEPKGSRRDLGGYQRERTADVPSPSRQSTRGAPSRGSVVGSPSGMRKKAPQPSPSFEEPGEDTAEEEDIIEEDVSDEYE